MIFALAAKIQYTDTCAMTRLLNTLAVLSLLCAVLGQRQVHLHEADQNEDSTDAVGEINSRNTAGWVTFPEVVPHVYCGWQYRRRPPEMLPPSS